MKEVFTQIAESVAAFPPILVIVVSAGGGSLAAAIVAAIVGGQEADTPMKLMGQFVVGWLVGCFCIPLTAPFLKLPTYTVGFITSGMGYWGMREYRIKKQKELMKRKSNEEPL